MVLTVTVTDNGTVPQSASAPVTVALSGTQAMPPVISNPAPFSVSENNKAGAKVGQIKPLAAYKGQTFGYALVGADAAAFSISSKGAITVTNALALNFETKPTYNFQVEVIDTTAGVLPAGTKSNDQRHGQRGQRQRRSGDHGQRRQ